MSDYHYLRRVITGLVILVFNVVSASSQSEGQDTLAQYLFPTFSNSTILTKNGKVYSLMMNYNLISENVVFIQKGTLSDLANPELVDTVYFGNRKFIRREKYFLEVLCSGKVSFFIRNKGDAVAPPAPTGYGTTSEITSASRLSGINTPQGYYNLRLPDGFVVRHSNLYYLRIDDNWTMFLSENQMIKAFPGREKELKQYIKDNHLRITRRDDLIRIGLYCNSMLSNR